MKKTISLLLALALCLSLCACGGGNDVPETTKAPAEPTAAPTEEETIPPTAEEPAAETTQPAGETEALYTPYIGRWVCSDGYYVIVNEDGTIVYNDAEYTPAFFEMGDGVAVHLEDAEYTYYAGMDKNGEVYITTKGCVFVWGLAEQFGEGVMVGDHDGRHFVFQAE